VSEMVEELKKVVQSLCEKYGVPARLESVSDTLDTILSLSAELSDEEATKLYYLVRNLFYEAEELQADELVKARICLKVLYKSYDYRQKYAEEMIEEELSRLPIRKVVFEELREYEPKGSGWEDAFYSGLYKLADAWVDYAEEKGCGEKEVREAIAFLKEKIDCLSGLKWKVENAPCFWRGKEVAKVFNPSVYELCLKLQDLGIDKTDAFSFSESVGDLWELLEMAEAGFTPEEIDVVKSYGALGYTVLSGCFYDAPFLNEEFFEEVVRELEKEHGLDEESLWEFVKKYDREILDSIDEVKFVEWEDNYAYYCKDEDLPKVKEGVKKYLLSYVEPENPFNLNL